MTPTILQACSIHPPFVECYASQGFSIASDLKFKVMPKKKKDQITIRKVCAVIQSFFSRCLNHHSDYGRDRDKLPTFHTFPWKVKITHDVTNVKHHKLSGVDASRLLSAMTSKRVDSCAQLSAAAGTTRQVFQTCSESQVGKGQVTLYTSPGERELV